ncbi:diguanylate cyclase/phosphodiesterase (GGDEF & EAL domains) with PAS/PAC sensor(s) [hydrothermal vent metagenome]|uniref:Diguanylate cyclase/phosphodiesterase (GGDEF & EAL domains) with PAS/PAC sensor(S) n=1 Tax=hydrothermal vent metagenome TaxID=652676 RepID=A0A3B0VTX6_9ZZZZ
MKKNTVHSIMERYQQIPPHKGKGADPCSLDLQTLEKIAEFNVQSNPIHYSVIYEWLSEVDPYFTDTVQTNIDNDNYNDHSAETLYMTLVTQFLHEKIPNEEMESLLNGLIIHINHWITHSKQRQSVILNDLHSILEQELSPVVSDTLTNRIMPNFISLHEETEQLREQVSKSSCAVDKLKEELKKANFFAKTDELTNIPNRRGFNENMEGIIQLSLQNQSPFALVLLDLDFFKKVNDTFGHIVGDSALRYVSKLLKEETKGRDRIARIGGEEFSIILPDTSYDNAVKVAENIRLKIASKTLSVKDQKKPLKLSLSSGVAIYRKGEDIDTLFQRADEALYLAKNSGRNRVSGERDLPS